MHFQKFSRLFVAPITCIAFFLCPFTSISVSATALSSNSDFWHWWYVEETTKRISGDNNGVDVSNASATYNGLTTGNYIYNNSGITEQDVIDYVTDQYNNATGYIADSANDYADKVKNVWNKTIDATTSASYKAEKALRTVVDATGKTVVNVSSSDYWNGIYNKWFNNSGYKDIYVDVTDNSYNVSYNGQNINFSFAGVGDYNYYMNSPTPKPAPANMFVSAPALFEEYVARTGSKNFAVGQMSVNGQIYYFLIGSNNNYYYPYSDFNVYSEDETRVHVTVKYDNIFYKDATFVFNGAINGVGTGGTSVLQPQQVGFIQYPLGSQTPIYTDKTLNNPDWTINDNGTVSIPNEPDQPIFADPDTISDNGWLDLLDLISDEDEREISLKDPWGFPWDTQDDGTTLGGFFGNLVKDIQKMFKGIGDKIKEIFQKPVEIISDLVEKIKTALTQFFTFSPNSINVDVSFNFNILESIWDAFLDQLGLS